MRDVNETQAELVKTLGELAEWLDRPGWAVVRPEGADAVGVAEDRKTVDLLRFRSSSTLLTVAMLGSFSAGKSFLLNGLQGHLSFERVIRSGSLNDKFVGLLPSSPQPTSSCPTRLSPVEGVGAGSGGASTSHMHARFDEDTFWTDLGPADMPGYVAAYVTESDFDVVNRRPEHRGRTVTEVEVATSRYLMPVTLFDLPGHNAPTRAQDDVVRSAMLAADAYLYVCRATATLTESDLELVRFLYAHHRETGKPVIWVVTAIDQGMNVGRDDRPEWLTTVDANNRYVREAVGAGGETADEFLGEGFVGVSPALEARGLAEELRPEGDVAEGRAMREASNMDALRDTLASLVERESGPRYVAGIAAQALSVLVPLTRLLDELVEAERVPYEALTEALESNAESLRQLFVARDEWRRSVRGALDFRLARATKPFTGSDGLARHLREGMRSRVEVADLRKTSTRNDIAVARLEMAREWMSRPDGPIAAWAAEAAGFRAELEGRLREVVEPAPADQDGDASVDRNLLALPARGVTDGQGDETVTKAVGMARNIMPIAGALLGAAGVASGAALVLVPVGAGLVAAGGLVALRRTGRKSTVLETMRAEELAGYDQDAAEAKAWFVEEVTGLANDLVARGEDLMANRVRDLRDAKARLAERAQHPEAMERKARLALLEELSVAGGLLARELDRVRGAAGVPDAEDNLVPVQEHAHPSPHVAPYKSANRFA